jgi:hypothetical protein
MANTSTVVDIESSENVIEVTIPAKKSKGKAKASLPSTSETNVVVPEVIDEFSALKKVVEALTKRVEELETSLKAVQDAKPTLATTGTSKSVKKDKEEKKQRAPTAYNIFMKTKMVELKESHPELNNIERMKMAAEAWSESKK